MRLSIPIPIRRGPDSISPTAHYTGHVWVRNGLSHDELATLEGRLLFEAVAPAMTVSRQLGGPTLEGMLLSRHRIIDELLAEAIDDGRVTQVLEVACGMSPRGWRFAERYGDALTYVEADLPEMAARKRRALERMGSLSDAHRVVDVDALKDGGPKSIAAVTSELDPDEGLAIVTEGLLAYFGADDVAGLLVRFADALSGFSFGLYLADLRLGGDSRSLFERGFQIALSSFVQRQVHVHFDGEDEAVDSLLAAGFAEARVRRGDLEPAAGDAGSDPAAARIHIIEATTG